MLKVRDAAKRLMELGAIDEVRERRATLERMADAEFWRGAGVEEIERLRRETRPLIYEIRGRQVMLDRDLAALYGVLTKNLNKAVKRNLERFPEDFMFQLTKEEWLRFLSGTLATGTIANMDTLRFQKGTSKQVATFDMHIANG